MSAEEIAMALSGQPQYLEQKTVGALQERDGKGIATTIDDKIILAFDKAQITNKEHGSQPSDVSQPLNTAGEMSVFSWDAQRREGYREGGKISSTLQARMGTGGNNVPLVGVRRLTPVECERLQGFPDGHTEGQSDSARYRQLGNAVTVNVIEWLGKRIMKFSGGDIPPESTGQ